MQIVPFLTHYQLVYANFDFSSFSLISYAVKGQPLLSKKAAVAFQKGCFHFSKGQLSRSKKAASAKPFAHFHAAEAQFPARHQTEMTRHAPRDDRPTRRVKDMERPSFHGKNDQTGLPRLTKTKAGKQP